MTRNCKNLFYYVSNTTVDLWWSHQYGSHWLHLCIADALSSPSFQIRVCYRHCSQLSTVMNNIVEPESGVTTLDNIVNNGEQCGSIWAAQHCPILFSTILQQYKVHIRSRQPGIISVMFRSLLWFYNNECKAQSNCIHDLTFRHSSLVSSSGVI